MCKISNEKLIKQLSDMALEEEYKRNIVSVGEEWEKLRKEMLRIKINTGKDCGDTIFNRIKNIYEVINAIKKELVPDKCKEFHRHYVADFMSVLEALVSEEENDVKASTKNFEKYFKEVIKLSPPKPTIMINRN